MDLSKKLLQLKAEITLKEKEYNKLLLDIEQLQKTKKTAFEQSTKEIKDNTEKIANLISKGKEMTALLTLQSEALEDIQNKINNAKEQYAKDKLDAENAVKAVYAQFDAEKRHVENMKKDVESRETALKDSQKELQAKENSIEIAENDYMQKVNILRDREKKITLAQIEVNKTLVKQLELLDDINTRVEQKRLEVKRLDESIKNKTQHAETIGQEQHDKAILLSIKEKDLKIKTEAMENKIIELNNKEAWLSDREATVGRAYKETLKRGGVVN